MRRKKLLVLLKTLEKEVKISRKRFEDNKRSANETSKTAAGSWSAGGDREYTANQAMISKKAFEQIEKLYNEISKAAKLPLPEVVKPPCYIQAEIKDKSIKFYLVENVINLSGIRLVSSNSPLGKRLEGKKIGDSSSAKSGLSGIKVIEIG